MAGFREELQKSTCISLKAVPGLPLWVAGVYSDLLVMLCRFMVWGPLECQVVLTLPYLGASSSSPSLFCLLSLHPSPTSTLGRLHPCLGASGQDAWVCPEQPRGPEEHGPGSVSSICVEGPLGRA